MEDVETVVVLVVRDRTERRNLHRARIKEGTLEKKKCLTVAVNDV